MTVVGSPACFMGRTPPRSPHDLTTHTCINLPFPTHCGVSMWEFEHAGHAVNVRVEGQLIVNDIALARLGALNGAGLAYLPADYVQPPPYRGRRPCARAGGLMRAVPGPSPLLSEPAPAIGGVRTDC